MSNLKNIKRIAKKIKNIPLAIKELFVEWRAKQSWLSPEEISEYRKSIKIYDVFAFFNELDLLEIRLNILDDYVDYFVIVEATETFSGHPKPLYYSENKERYKKWSHKIIHCVVDTVPRDEEDLRHRLLNPNIDLLEKQTVNYALASHTVGLGVSHWLKEFYIKESIKKALVGLNDNDICYVSDLDEIWNPELIIDYSKDDIFKPRQVAYVYYLNNRSDEHWRDWTGTMVTKYKNIKNSSLCGLLKNGATRQIGLRNGGWHFTFQGGAEGAKRKIEESNHPWYKAETTLPDLDKKVQENRDYKGRNFKFWVDESQLPKYLIQNKDKYQKYFK